MFRRKVRTFLTIFGIMIGIFALTVMGALAVKLNKSISESKKFVTSQISLTPKGSNGPSEAAFISISTLDQVRKIPGVAEVRPVVSMPLEEQQGLSFGNSDTIEGIDLSGDVKNRSFKGLSTKSGRLLQEGDTDQIVIGSTTAVSKKWRLGQAVMIRGKQFTVAGIMDKTEGPADSYVFMSISSARQLLINANEFLKSLEKQSRQASSLSGAALASLPAQQRAALKQESAFKADDVATLAAVYWTSGTDPEVLTGTIRGKVSGLSVYSPHDFAKVIDQATVTLNLIILGSAAIALVVGSLSVINTMIMAISERTREIGVKRAIGARTRNILFEYLTEAGMIGLIGGLLGLGAGSLVAYEVNKTTAHTGTIIFAVTPALAVGVVVFAVVLGVVAGFYPAIHAARINPVKALRSE